MGKAIVDNRIALQKFIITKSLSKLPQNYPDAKTQPHVQVALKMQAAGKHVGVGQHIPYVICKGDGPIAQRAFHPDHIVKAGGALEIDFDWYLKTQVHPPILRLCEPISGTDAMQLAQCLGLDPEKFRQSVLAAERAAAAQDGGDDADADADLLSGVALDPSVKYRDCEPLRILCAHCRQSSELCGIREGADAAERALADAAAAASNSSSSSARARRLIRQPVGGLRCPHCARSFGEHELSLYVVQAVRRCVAQYYEGWMKCDSRTCQSPPSKQLFYRHQSASSPFGHAKCPIPGCDGEMRLAYDESRLLLDLEFLRYSFDVASEKKLKAEVDAEQHAEFVTQLSESGELQMYERLRALVDEALNRNDRYMLDLSKVFFMF
jgi:DNA polymerase alpha subunit A